MRVTRNRTVTELVFKQSDTIFNTSNTNVRNTRNNCFPGKKNDV